MGKAAKAKRSLERKNKKRAAKAVMQAQYTKWADEGRNSKSKRFRSKGGASLSRERDPKCKNIGDLVSHPEMLETVERLYHKDVACTLYSIAGLGTKTRQYTGKYRGLMRNRNLTNPLLKLMAEDHLPHFFRTHTGRKLTADELAV